MISVTRFDGFILSAAVLLTTATQLRVDGIPIGPGEALLLVWMGWRILVVGMNPLDRIKLGSAPYFIVFWSILLVTLLTALAIAYVRGSWDESGAGHNMIAYLLSAILSILLAQAIATDDSAQVVARNLFIMFAAVLFLLLVLAASRRTIFGIDPWYSTIRFRGWSANPNQLGIILSPLPFLAIWAIPWRPGNRMRLVAGLVVILAAGLLCQSDALLLSWLIAGSFLGAVFWVSAISTPDTTSLRAFVFVVLLPSGALALIIWLSTGLIGQLVGKVIQIYEFGGQGSVRLALWSHGYEAFAQSPILGHGPGAFSGTISAFGGHEAHNTLIDVATQSGLLGLTLYLGLVIIVHVQLVRAKQYILLAAVMSISVFSLFHFILRQPIFWTVMVIGLHTARCHTANIFSSCGPRSTIIDRMA